MATKHRRGQRGIHLLRADIAQFAVENEIIPLGAQIDGGFLAEEDEGEDIAVLLQTEL